MIIHIHRTINGIRESEIIKQVDRVEFHDDIKARFQVNSDFQTTDVPEKPKNRVLHKEKI